jgi:hypothetical protein
MAAGWAILHSYSVLYARSCTSCCDYPSAAQIAGLLLPWRASALGWRICSCEISADDLAAKLPIDPLRAGFALARLGLDARRWGTSRVTSSHTVRHTPLSRTRPFHIMKKNEG